METTTSMTIAISDAARVRDHGFRLQAPVWSDTQGISLSAIVACALVAQPEAGVPAKAVGTARLAGYAPFAGAARTTTQIATHNSMDDSDIRTGRPPV